MERAFHGAKAAVLLGDDLLVYQRDSHVVWPGRWDFPGGGREGDESAIECLRREVFEEFGLEICEADVVWERWFPAMLDHGQEAVFFVVMLAADRSRDIRFGEEGQRWQLLAPADVAQLPDFVPGLLDRYRLWLNETGRDPI